MLLHEFLLAWSRSYSSSILRTVSLWFVWMMGNMFLLFANYPLIHLIRLIIHHSMMVRFFHQASRTTLLSKILSFDKFGCDFNHIVKTAYVVCECCSRNHFTSIRMKRNRFCFQQQSDVWLVRSASITV